MPRGLFTQSAAVLFTEVPHIEQIESALSSLGPITRRDTQPGWISGGAELLFAFGESGHVHVDLVASPWPDALGRNSKDSDLIAAYAMGAFGPLAHPGGLGRAAEHAFDVSSAEVVTREHRAFVRLRTSYLVGAGEKSALLPDGWSAIAELSAMLRLVPPILDLEGAAAYFDPNAELLLSPDAFRSLLAEGDDDPPLELFTHVRRFQLDHRWSVMDTVGMERFFLPDFELLVESERDVDESTELLRDACAYLLSRGAVMEDGHTLEGPDGTLLIQAYESPLAAPPRRVLRLLPEGAELPTDVD